MNIHEFEKEILKTFPCEGMYGPCGNTPSDIICCRTQYCNEEENINPIMCKDCTKEYNQYWDEMWSDYWSSIL